MHFPFSLLRTQGFGDFHISVILELTVVFGDAGLISQEEAGGWSERSFFLLLGANGAS